MNTKELIKLYIKAVDEDVKKERETHDGFSKFQSQGIFTS